MIVLVDLAIGLLILAVAALLFGLGLKLIKENSKQEKKDEGDCCGRRFYSREEEKNK